MQLNASEISDLIKKQIEGFDFAAEARTEGTVISVSDGIVRIHGLADVQFGEMLEFPGKTFGMALNLEQDSVGAVVLGNYLHISEGNTVKCTNRLMEVPVGEAMLGRVVNCNSCFACLSVANNQLSLSATYWYHCVNRLNTSRKYHHRLSRCF
jgi:F-type H+-transporting ATPase subunit alpha